MGLILNSVTVISCLILMCACNSSSKGSGAGSVSTSGISQPLPIDSSPVKPPYVPTSKRDILALGSLLDESLEVDKNLLLMNSIRDKTIKMEMDVISSNAKTTIAVKGHDIIEEAKATINCEANGSNECI